MKYRIFVKHYRYEQFDKIPQILKSEPRLESNLFAREDNVSAP